jgi:GTPase SAR1 family protein
MSAPPAPPAALPYDYLFKVLIIGDASVGKVSCCSGVTHHRFRGTELRTSENLDELMMT